MEKPSTASEKPSAVIVEPSAAIVEPSVACEKPAAVNEELAMGNEEDVWRELRAKGERCRWLKEFRREATVKGGVLGAAPLGRGVAEKPQASQRGGRAPLHC
jgi:hypothetical protein